MKTTEEGNKLIAEFMGHKINWGFNKDSILYMPQGDGNATNNSVVIPLDKLKYNSSWDWLMPVVDKVADQHDQYTYFNVGHIFDAIRDCLYCVNIKHAWAEVIRFIEWYNKQK